MFCTKCGNQLKENARFCTKCGAPIRSKAAEPAQSEPGPAPAVNTAPEPASVQSVQPTQTVPDPAPAPGVPDPMPNPAAAAAPAMDMNMGVAPAPEAPAAPFSVAAADATGFFDGNDSAEDVFAAFVESLSEGERSLLSALLVSNEEFRRVSAAMKLLPDAAAEKINSAAAETIGDAVVEDGLISGFYREDIRSALEAAKP